MLKKSKATCVNHNFGSFGSHLDSLEICNDDHEKAFLNAAMKLWQSKICYEWSIFKFLNDNFFKYLVFLTNDSYKD